MFAPLTPQHQTRRTMALGFGSKTPLSIAMGIALSCTALQVQAANNGQVYNEIPVADAAVEYESDNYENDNAQQVVSERLKMPNKSLDRSKLSNSEFVAKQAELFFECTQVQTSAARLACFDKVAEDGETPSYTSTKQSLDLAKTFKSTLSGNPQVVFAEENTTSIVQTTRQILVY